MELSLIFTIAVGIVCFFLVFAIYWLITNSREASGKKVPHYLVEGEYDEAVERSR